MKIIYQKITFDLDLQLQKSLLLNGIFLGNATNLPLLGNA